MQNVSIKKFAEMCYIKDSAYIRQMLLNGKLVGFKKDRAWLINVDDPVNADYLQKRRQEFGFNTYQDTESNTVFSTEIPTSNTVVSSIDNTQLIRDLIKEIKELAEEKGKTALLTDNLRQKEHDVDYWKSEYFKLQQKYEVLLLENTELKTQSEIEKIKLLEECKILQKENIELKEKQNKKWWQVKVI